MSPPTPDPVLRLARALIGRDDPLAAASAALGPEYDVRPDGAISGPGPVEALEAQLAVALAAARERSRAAARETALHQLSAELGAATTPAGAREVVARLARAILGSPRSVFAMPDGAGRLRLAGADLVHSDIRSSWASFPVDSDLPLARAFRERRTLVHATQAELVAGSPSMARIVEIQGTRAGVAAPLRSADRVVGAVAFGFDEERSFDPEEIALVETLANQCAVVLDRATLLEQARHDAQVQRFLAEASVALARSLDPDATLRTLAELSVPSFADWAIVDLFGPDDSVRRVAVHHADPAMRALARDVFERYPPQPHEVRALRSRTPLLLPDVTDDLLRAGSRDDEHLAVSRSLGLRSMILTRLEVHGEVCGAITFIRTGEARPYEPHDLELATDLARRTSVALENAGLYQEVREAEARIAREQRRFERMADATPDILFVIAVPRVRNLYASPEIGRILGRTSDELAALGDRLLDVLVHPEDAEPLRSELADVRLADGERLEQRFRMRHVDGGYRWFDVRSVVFARDREGRPTELLGVARDVTGDRAREDALRDSEERYRLATEAVRGVVYEWDLATDRVRQTAGLLDVAGTPPSERTADRAWWRGRIHPEDRGPVEDAWAGALARGLDRLELEYRIRHQDGSWRWVRDSALLVGAPSRVVGCAVDVTERVRAQRELEEADRRKDQFLALLAHELRNPLAAVRNAAEVLARGGPSTARDAIVRQVGHMARLLEDLFDVSRMSTGKLQIRAEPVEVGALVSSVVDDHRGPLERYGLRVRVHAPDRPAWVRGDPTRLAQIVGNLLHNAGKFTEPGGSVDVRVEAGDGKVAIEVEDTGAGIDPGLLPTLFEPFVQGRRVLDQSRGGLGLGLALVRGLAEVHRGNVGAWSDGLGRGARFRVELPASAPPERGEPESAQPRATRRILLVEDNDDAAQMLKLLLEHGGHRVEVASDGGQAIELAGRIGPEVVLCDIGLPGGLDGYDVARAIRAMPGGGGFLIALTGYGQAEDQERARAAGFDRHLTKPVDPAELERILGSG